MRITGIVPTYNSERTLRSCLESLQNQDYGDTEIIVVDNGSKDATQEIAEELADKVFQQGPERCAQRNRGAAEATGDIIIFFDSDMVMEPSIFADIAGGFENDPDLGAITIPERSFGEGYLAECRALEKSLYVGSDEVEAPRAFRREVFDAVGRWDETLTAAEDWDLADRTRANGVKVGRIDSWIWHDEGKIDLFAQYKKKKYYGRWVAEYLHRNRSNNHHVTRPGVFASLGSAFREDPRHATGMVALKAVESAGLAAGIIRARRQGLSQDSR